MALAKKWLYLAIGVIVVLIAGYFIASRLHPKPQPLPPTMKVGVVDMTKVVPLNPQYQHYKQLQADLDKLQRQYFADQKNLTLKSQQQSQSLQSLGTDNSITDSLNADLAAKINAKEQELNVDLQKKRIELINKYRGQMTTAPTEADLRIVNLQLEIYGKTEPVAINDEQKAAFQKDREAKIAELNRLLAERGGNVNGSMAPLEAKVDAELVPYRNQRQQELEAYAQQLHNELAQRRDSLMQAKAQSIMSTNNLPDSVAWNQQWNSKLKAKQQEVDALHDAIVEDVRAHASIIAKEKGLDLVVTSQVANIKGVDITDDIIASYN